MYYPSLVQDEQQERNGEALTLEMILSLATFNHNAAHLGSTSNNQTTLFSPYPGNTVPSLETLSFVQTTTTCIDNLRMSEQVVELKELDEFTQWYTWNNNEAARQQEASIEHHNLIHLVQDSMLIPQPQQQNDTPDTNEVMKVGDSSHFCSVTNHPAGPVAVRDIEQESIEPYPRNFIFKGFSYDKEKNKIKFINHCDSKEGKNDGPWSEREHQLFLIGLKRLGRGKWRDISQSYVRTRTRIQVASHAQKYFARQRMRGNNESSNTNE